MTFIRIKMSMFIVLMIILYSICIEISVAAGHQALTDNTVVKRADKTGAMTPNVIKPIVYRFGMGSQTNSFYPTALFIISMCNIYQRCHAVLLQPLTTYGDEENIELLQKNKIDLAIITQEALEKYTTKENSQSQFYHSLFKSRIRIVTKLCCDFVHTISNNNSNSNDMLNNSLSNTTYLVANNSVDPESIYTILVELEKSMAGSNYPPLIAYNNRPSKLMMSDMQGVLHFGAVRFFKEYKRIIPQKLLP